jgi:hypothetical protein
MCEWFNVWSSLRMQQQQQQQQQQQHRLLLLDDHPPSHLDEGWHRLFARGRGGILRVRSAHAGGSSAACSTSCIARPQA